MYISKIKISNIRCFEDITLNFEKNGEPILWTTFLGDNATGKTALLRSIAMGLCDESSAAGLLRESEQGYIRRVDGTELADAEIFIELKDRKYPHNKYKIKTTFVKEGDNVRHSFEKLKQTIKTQTPFLWDNLFVCAYGTGRGVAGSGDILGYSVINAVYNLFVYSEGLQNPELTLLRLGRGFISRMIERKSLFRILKEILGLGKDNEISVSSSGILIDGPWGKKMPLRDLADGYKSTFLWITDLFGWALNFDKGIIGGEDIVGIVLIDEIEQHLHPKWQSKIVQLLRTEFPNIQFIVTTHSPIIASNTSISIDEDLNGKNQLIHLELKDGNKVVDHDIDLVSIKGLDLDQVLASRGFDYLININPEIDNILRMASELASKDQMTKKEKEKFEKVKYILNGIYKSSGKSLAERIAQDEVDAELSEEISKLEQLLLNNKNDKN